MPATEFRRLAAVSCVLTTPGGFASACCKDQERDQNQVYNHSLHVSNLYSLGAFDALPDSSPMGVPPNLPEEANLNSNHLGAHCRTQCRRNFVSRACSRSGTCVPARADS